MFRHVLTATMNGDVIDRKPAGRKRPRFKAWERREQMLQAAFAEISEAKPERLRGIIDRCDLFLRIARIRHNLALEQHARAIGLRAATRLKSIRRQGAGA
jgi:hypothetical protein